MGGPRSELEADGDVDSVALERVLGVELAVPFRENGQRLRGIGARGEAHDRAHAVNPQLE